MDSVIIVVCSLLLSAAIGLAAQRKWKHTQDPLPTWVIVVIAMFSGVLAWIMPASVPLAQGGKLFATLFTVAGSSSLAYVGMHMVLGYLLSGRGVPSDADDCRSEKRP